MKKLSYVLLCLFLFKVSGFTETIKIETNESFIVQPGERYVIDENGQIVKEIHYNDSTNPVMKEIKEAFFRDIRVGYFYDLLRDSPQDRGKLGVSSPMISYKILSLDPNILYNPNNAHSTTDLPFLSTLSF